MLQFTFEKKLVQKGRKKTCHKVNIPVPTSISNSPSLRGGPFDTWGAMVFTS